LKFGKFTVRGGMIAFTPFQIDSTGSVKVNLYPKLISI
jgi:hypothetical protein